MTNADAIAWKWPGAQWEMNNDDLSTLTWANPLNCPTNDQVAQAVADYKNLLGTNTTLVQAQWASLKMDATKTLSDRIAFIAHLMGLE